MEAPPGEAGDSRRYGGSGPVPRGPRRRESSGTRIRLRDRLHPDELDAGHDQPEDAERQGEPVIARHAHGRPAQRAPADHEPVVGRCGVAAERRHRRHRGRDAVRLLVAQVRRADDPRLAVGPAANAATSGARSGASRRSTSPAPHSLAGPTSTASPSVPSRRRPPCGRAPRARPRPAARTRGRAPAHGLAAGQRRGRPPHRRGRRVRLDDEPRAARRTGPDGEHGASRRDGLSERREDRLGQCEVAAGDAGPTRVIVSPPARGALSSSAEAGWLERSAGRATSCRSQRRRGPAPPP